MLSMHFIPGFPSRPDKQKSLLPHSTSALLLLGWKGAAVKVSAGTDVLSERLGLLCLSDSYFLGIKTQFMWPLWGNSGSTSGD